MENIEWLKDVIYLIPVAGLIWKAATMGARIKQNETDIKECKKVVDRQNESIISSLDKLQETMTEIRTDVSVLKALRKEEKDEK